MVRLIFDFVRWARSSWQTWWGDENEVLFTCTNVVYACFCVDVFIAVLWIFGL